ncbi:hypothetical protein M3Y94_00987000 [Aphelenchoides besseyi]|nr:hypothetical protein M3Y94_00987000 [Aphelenchoides besseyi]
MFWYGGTAMLLELVVICSFVKEASGVETVATGQFACTMDGQAWIPDAFPADYKPDGIDKVHPVCPGDFKQFYEFWSVKKEGLPAAIPQQNLHTTILSKFNRSIGANAKMGPEKIFNGVYYSLFNDDRFLFAENVPDNKRLYIWSMHVKSVHPGAVCPMDDPYRNAAHDVDNKNASYAHTVCPNVQPIENIPMQELSINLRGKMKDRCGVKAEITDYCAIDMDSDGSVMVVDPLHRIIVHKGGMDLVAKVHEYNGKSYPYYMIRFEGLWFYFPQNLATFADNNFLEKNALFEKYRSRYLLLPIIGNDETFFLRRFKFTSTTTTTAKTTHLLPTTMETTKQPTSTKSTTTTEQSPSLGYAHVAVAEQTTVAPPSTTSNKAFKTSADWLSLFVWVYVFVVIVG